MWRERRKWEILQNVLMNSGELLAKHTSFSLKSKTDTFRPTLSAVQACNRILY